MLSSAFFGFIGGVLLGSFIPINLGFFIACILITLLIFSYKYFVDTEHKPVVFTLFIFMCMFLVGFGRVGMSDIHKESELQNFLEKKITVEGVIVDEPDVRENNVKLTVRVSAVLAEEETIEVREKILVTVPLYPEFSYGDKVRMSVTLVEPEEIETDGRVFDYIGYLRVRGIWYTSRFTSIEFVSAGHGSYIKSLLFRTKNAFTNSIKRAIPEPESGLLGGLLLGSKHSLGQEVLKEFQRTGVSHIVVLSGYNIAIVANSIMEFFKFLPKQLSFGFGMVGIILFAILSGGGASAWRASIMVLVALFAKHTNREYNVGRIFGVTILAMLIPNPLLLVFDPSFQLSVLATMGLIFVSPILSPHLSFISERFGLREIVSSTLATQVTVLPFLIYNMGMLSLVSLPVNVLILSTIPITMLLGFLTGFFGLFSLWLSFVPALFTYGLLWYQLFVVHVGSSIPFGAVMLPAFSGFWLVCIYLVMFFFLRRAYKKTAQK